jgi:glycosyltransferase involved in cell wall biosynthesis
MERRLKLFTWHIHGSYLYYLSQGNFEIFVPINSDKTVGYIGRGTTFPFGDNIREVPVEHVKSLPLDCILFQTPQNYLVDQYEIFSPQQLLLPKVYLEHDPPQAVPTDTQHVVSDPNVTLVHVTHFNKLMWDNGSTPATVIEHGVMIEPAVYNGEIARGIVVINNLDERGRRLGLDVFQEVRKHVPLDLIGMGAEKLGGIGEILHPQIPEFIRHYRFFFNPIRYTSLGLAVLEAMLIGIPIVGLATTEMVTVIEHGRSGILHTDINVLIDGMKELIKDRDLAFRLGVAGQKQVARRFHIRRFVEDWYRLLNNVVNNNFVEPRGVAHGDHYYEEENSIYK